MVLTCVRDAAQTLTPYLKAASSSPAGRSIGAAAESRAAGRCCAAAAAAAWRTWPATPAWTVPGCSQGLSQGAFQGMGPPRRAATAGAAAAARRPRWACWGLWTLEGLRAAAAAPARSPPGAPATPGPAASALPARGHSRLSTCQHQEFAHGNNNHCRAESCQRATAGTHFSWADCYAANNTVPPSTSQRKYQSPRHK